MRTIPSNTSMASLRRIAFTLVDGTDFATPKDITVSGVKVTMSVDGGTPTSSTNDIVKVNGTNGEYYIELTQAESNQTPGAVIRGYLKPTGCALTKLQAQVGVADTFTASTTLNTAIAQETLLTFNMGRGNKIVDNGTSIVLYGTDGTTVLQTTARTRAGTAQNPVISLG